MAKALVSKGMLTNEGHHTMFRKTIDGVTTMVTRMSHDAHPIDDHLGKRMANQCVLTLAEFWRLIDCTLSEEDWDMLVKQRCVNGRNPYLRG